MKKKIKQQKHVTFDAAFSVRRLRMSSLLLLGISKEDDHSFSLSFVLAPYTVKRLIIFTSPAAMSLTKLSLGRNNLIIPSLGEFG
jgi:hypothetical protein